MEIIKTTIPEQSMLMKNGVVYDYADSFQGAFADGQNRLTATTICRIFFSSSPAWVENLYEIRNRIVGLFGLKASKKQKDRRRVLNNLPFDYGDQFGLFQVFAKTENEVLLGANDKHLNFRVSLLLTRPANEKSETLLNISTTVIYNNRSGRIYFAFVRPFHRLIVPAMLKAAIKKLKTELRITPGGSDQ